MTQRLSLLFLLFLLLFGLAGHLFTPANGMQHDNSESACAIHAGIIFPEKLNSTWIGPDTSLEPINDNTRAICLAAKIPHPPNF
jgi:hypothetical protein